MQQGETFSAISAFGAVLEGLCEVLEWGPAASFLRLLPRKVFCVPLILLRSALKVCCKACNIYCKS